MRPWASARLSPFVRAELALVATAHFGRVWELTGGVGLWLRLHRRVAAFVEVDVGQHVPPALRTAAHGETRLVRTDVDAARHAHDVALSGRRPRVVSSCRMCA